MTNLIDNKINVNLINSHNCIFKLIVFPGIDGHLFDGYSGNVKSINKFNVI